MGVYSKGVSVHDPAVGTATNITELGVDDAQFNELAQRVSALEEGFAWLSLVNPTDAEAACIAGLYELDPFQVDDAMNVRQRAKVEVESHNAFTVMKVLDYVEATSDIETSQISCFVGHGFTVTITLGRTDILTETQQRLVDGNLARQIGATAVCHAVLDTVVDQYLAVVDEISVDVENLEDRVFSPERTDDSADLYELKRENLEIKRAIAPLVPMASMVMNDQLTEMRKNFRPHFRDISDHLLRANDTVENNDQLMGSMLQASNARQELQQNTDMRKISAYVAILAVPTMIAGIYGMNFDDMPELHEKWGYPVVLVVMLMLCGVLYWRFKKSKWL